MNVSWTDEIQAFTAIGTLIVGVPTMLMVLSTLKLQIQATTAQTKATELQAKQLRLHYKPVISIKEIAPRDGYKIWEFCVTNSDLMIDRLETSKDSHVNIIHNIPHGLWVMVNKKFVVKTRNDSEEKRGWKYSSLTLFYKDMLENNFEKVYFFLEDGNYIEVAPKLLN